MSNNETHIENPAMAHLAAIDSEKVVYLAEAFRVLGDPTKLRICMLLSGSELPVSQIARQLDLSGSAVSHSLRVLRNLRLVKFRRDGRMIYYSLDDEHVEELIRVAYFHVVEDER